VANSGNEANVKLNGDASSLVRASALAQGSLAKLQGQLTALETLSAKSFSASGIAGIGLSATAAAGALMAAVKSTADYGDALDNLSKRTGESVEDLSRLQYAAKMSDVSNEALGKGMKYLAGQIVGAANGAKDSSELFDKYGIAVRDVDGKVRGTADVLGDLADVFAEMPDGTEKAALAAEFFGSRLGSELIPLLNEGRAGIKALGDEAERLGLVMSSKQAAAAAEFNDNMDRLAARAKGAAVALGNELIPVLNTFLNEFSAGMENSNGFFDALVKFGLTNPFKDKVKQAKELADEVAKLEDKISIGRGQKGDDERLKALQQELAYHQKINGEKVANDEETATKRKSIALNLARELANLEQLRAIAAGKASADILKDDKTRTAEQIKEAEKLRDALRSAWDTSRKEAQTAADDATKLLAKASGVRTSAADKATQMREAGLSEEERQAANLSRAQDAQGQGAYYAAAAAAAALDGRAKDVEKYQKQAEQFLERAAKFAEAAGNADLVEQVGKDQAGLLEQQAKGKQAESEKLKAQADQQLVALKDVETKLTDLQTKAAALEIKVKIDDAIGKVAEFQKALDALPKDKTVTLTVNTVNNGASTAPADTSKMTRQELIDAIPGYDGGGWTGPGGKFKAAGIVHADEFVVTKDRVNEPGALDFLWRFHKFGMNALKGYADGGLVGRMSIPSLNMPSPAMASQSGTPLVLDFGKLGRYQASASSDTAGELVKVFKRAAMQSGRR